MRVTEGEVIQQTGKPLPPVVLEDDGRAPRTVPYSTLLMDVLLKRIILGSLVLIAMNVVQYTLINWLPTVLTTQGINLKDSIILNTMSMSGTPSGIFIAMLVMDKIPRKTMGVESLVLTAVLRYVYSLQTSMLLITLIGFLLIALVYMYVCYVLAVYIPEIWPTEAKLRGSGLADTTGYVSSTTVPYTVAVLLSGYGVTDVLVLPDAVSIIVAVAIAAIGIETKGVSIESLGIDAATSK